MLAKRQHCKVDEWNIWNRRLLDTATVNEPVDGLVRRLVMFVAIGCRHMLLIDALFLLCS